MRAFFLPVGSGQRFCIYHPVPDGEPRGAVIYVHPFAEEMNKSRRMAALQARALAAAGFCVLQIDLLGCGDSSGDFGDASWDVWCEDLLHGYRWVRTQCRVPVTFWGLRAGCLLAADAAASIPEEVDFIFWHPVVSGAQYWQQFMRLKMAAGLASNDARGIAEKLKDQLAAGQMVEIAGYTVSPALATGLQRAQLLPKGDFSGRLTWLELSMREGAGLAPVSQQYIERWKAADFIVEASVVQGPAFWQTAEIEDAHGLLPLTLAAQESWQ